MGSVDSHSAQLVERIKFGRWTGRRTVNRTINKGQYLLGASEDQAIDVQSRALTVLLRHPWQAKLYSEGDIILPLDYGITTLITSMLPDARSYPFPSACPGFDKVLNSQASAVKKLGVGCLACSGHFSANDSYTKN